MARLQRILLISSVFALLLGFGWNVGISEAHPSGHSHEHIFSSHGKHNHSVEAQGENKFYCPMHKHFSSLPCPRLHTREDMAHPEQCKIGPDCGGGSQKSLPENSRTDRNHGLNDGATALEPPAFTKAPVSKGWPHNSPQPDVPWHPPQSL
jgi:hypothetical protein